jgi:hypothetical protein
MRWAGHVARIGERWGAYRILVRRHDGKSPLGRHTHRMENNIKMNIKEVGGGMNWIDLAQVRDRWRDSVNVVIKLRVP